MKPYRVIATVATVPPGAVVGFTTPDQHRRRAQQVEALGGGRFRALQTLQFKRGEIFGVDGDMPKAMAEVLAPPDSERAAAADPKKPKRQAAAKASPPGDPGGPPKKEDEDTAPGGNGDDTGGASEAGGNANDTVS